MKSFNILLAALLLCLPLCACGEGGKSGDNAPSAIVTVPTDQPGGNKASQCVKTLREETFTYTDKNKNAVSTVYRIPALVYDTADAKAINADISARYSGMFNAAHHAVKQNKNPEPDSIDFNAYLNDDIVTLLIISEGQGHSLTYQAYNYNKTTGKRLDNASLLLYLQRDYDDTFRTLSKTLEEDYLSKFKLENFPDDYYYQLDLTVGDEAIRKSQLFLNENAELYAVCTEYAGVGSGEFQVLMRC